MFIDYTYYTSWGGTKISQAQFDKYAFKGCNYITVETFGRVTDDSISNYPSQLITLIKNCACELAEKYFDYDKAYNNMLDDTQNIKSEKSGYASIEYKTDSSSSKFVNDFNNYLKSTFMLYLSPREIDGVLYNLTSKIISNNPCKSCCII